MIICPECKAKNEDTRNWCIRCGLHFLARWFR